MEFTFGIITCPSTSMFLDSILDSIERQNIPKYEIIIVGDCKLAHRPNVNLISFDETIHPGWITRKKNIITENAKYENIVFLHDYILLDDDWYKGFLRFGNDFDVVSNIIHDIDGNRFRDWNMNTYFIQGYYLNNGHRSVPMFGVWDDWIVKPDSITPMNPILYQSISLHNGTLLDYTINTEHIQRYMYISGTYWVAKKKVMMEIPLNENLLHCQGEDVEWSQRLRDKYKYSFNSWSKVHLLKRR
jgi:glycosyltransferase involved in cell wall biosynthesis